MPRRATSRGRSPSAGRSPSLSASTRHTRSAAVGPSATPRRHPGRHDGLRGSPPPTQLLRVIAPAALFVFGQAGTSLATQAAKNDGVEALSFATVLPNYFALFVAGAAHSLLSSRHDTEAAKAPGGTAGLRKAPKGSRSASPLRPSTGRELAVLAFACTAHVTAFVCMAGAIGRAGSGLYSVGLSLMPVYVALFSALLLGRALAPAQWLAMVAVVGGLAVVALSPSGDADAAQSSPVHQHYQHDKENGERLIGVVLALAASGLLSMSSVCNESLLTNKPLHCCRRVSPSSSSTGGYDARGGPSFTSGTLQLSRAAIGVAMTCAAIAAYTLPRWNDLVVAPIVKAAVSSGVGATDAESVVVPVLAVAMARIMVPSACMTGGYFAMATVPGGAVVAGVLAPLSTVVVYCLSHVWHCSEDNTTQCATPMKTIGALTVVGGILWFNIARAQLQLDGTAKQ